MPASRQSSVGLSSFSLRKPSEIDILLDDHDDSSFVHSYTGFDTISGHVSMVCAKDTPFQELEISFEGVTETYIEKVASTAPTSGRTIGRHRFLRVLQPIDRTLLPQDKVASAGAKYQIPFEFVVPDRLLDSHCTHRVDNPLVHEAHLQLPPSLGDPMLAGDGQTLQDDLAPEMAKIQYTIKAKLVKSYPTATKSSEAVEKGVKVRIVPAKEEEPPLDIDQESKDFELSKGKNVRKGLFKGKLGRLTVEAHQPSGFRLPALKKRSTSTISTKTTIDLRFDPVDSKVQPPTLGSLVSKLRAKTFFCSEPFRSFPSRSTLNRWDFERGLYVRTVELSSRCISSVEWQKHNSAPASATNSPRTRSSCSDQSLNGNRDEAESASASSAGLPFYTAKVLVPLALPQNKSFPPTFFSCLVNRIYALELNLSYHVPSATVSTPSIQLRLPIQISAEGNPDAAMSVSAEEAEAIVAQEVDAEMAEGRWLPRRTDSPIPIPEYSERQQVVNLAALPRRGRHSRTTDEGPPAYSPAISTPPHLRGGAATPRSMAALDSTARTARASSVSVK